MLPSLCFSLLSFQLFVTFCLRGFSPHRWVWIFLHLHQSCPHLLLSLESRGSASPCPFSMDPPCLSVSSWPLSLRPCLPSFFQFTCSCLCILSSVSIPSPQSAQTHCASVLSLPSRSSHHPQFTTTGSPNPTFTSLLAENRCGYGQDLVPVPADSPLCFGDLDARK